MNSVVVYRRRGAITDSFVGSGSGGGGVDDDILRRLGNVETDVSELRAEVHSISATIPHLATAASVSDLRSEVAAISAVIPHLATKADLKAEIGKVETQVASLEAAIIKWIIATVLTTAGLAFSIAKFVH